jgi:peptidyl-prolyl cis-trans isomerase C
VKSHLVIAAAIGLVPLGLALSGPAAWAQTGTQTTAEKPAAEQSATGQSAAEETAAEQATPGPAADQGAGGYSMNSPLADVDGVTLTLGELVTIRQQLPQQYQKAPDEVLMKALTEQLIDQQLLAEAGRKEALQDKPAVRLKLQVQERAILAEAYLRAEIAKRATPEAIEALYKQRYVDAPPEEEVHAAHILVDSEEKAKEVKAKLDAGGDFAKLAAEYGTDGTASRGGDLGWFVHSEMVPEFADAAFAMKPETISDPVQTNFGWHIIKLFERRARKAPELEQVRGELLRQVVVQAQADVVAELRKKATIVKADQPPPAQAVRDDAILNAVE